MTVDEFERQAYHTVQKFSFIKAVATVDKTTNTILMTMTLALKGPKRSLSTSFLLKFRIF